MYADVPCRGLGGARVKELETRRGRGRHERETSHQTDKGHFVFLHSPAEMSYFRRRGKRSEDQIKWKGRRVAERGLRSYDLSGRRLRCEWRPTGSRHLGRKAHWKESRRNRIGRTRRRRSSQEAREDGGSQHTRRVRSQYALERHIADLCSHNLLVEKSRIEVQTSRYPVG